MLPMAEAGRVTKTGLAFLLTLNRLIEAGPLPPGLTQQIRDKGPSGEYVGPTSRSL